MGRSLGFGSITNDLDALFRLAFAVASPLKGLTLPLMITRRLIMQKARGHSFLARKQDIELPQLVGIWFQVLFTPLKGVLFTFQSPYWFTIGRQVVLSLGWWSTLLHTVFHEDRATLEQPRIEKTFRIRGFHPLWPAVPDCSAGFFQFLIGCPQPRSEDRFGLVRFRSPLLTESRLISFPPGT